MKRLVYFIITVLVFGAAVTYGCSKEKTNKQDNSSTQQVIGERPEVGYLAPDFAVADIEGNELKLSSLRGEQVFLNFWTSWCEYCVAEMPALQAVHENGKIKVVTINLTSSERSTEKMRQFLQTAKYSFPVGMDSTGKVGRLYQVRSIPASFFLDRQGFIRAVYNEPLTKEIIEERFAEFD